MNIPITRTTHSRIKDLSLGGLGFGEVFSDHMLGMEYRDGAWGEPAIVPYGDIAVSPAMAALHYGQVIFEGLKAFRTPNGVTIFRPEKFCDRMHMSCGRLCIPPVPREVFMEGVRQLVALDAAWVPPRRGYSLYIRPFIFASEAFLGVRVSESYRFMIITSPVGAYFAEGMKPVRLMTSGEYVRAVKGGLGAAKTIANYAASLLPAREARLKGYTQVLWLDGLERRYIEEVGTMNICFLIGDELVTPSLEGTILAGITRETVLQLAASWGIKTVERRISIDELFEASKQGLLKEAFGTGTAAVISPVGEIAHNGARISINSNKPGPLAQRLHAEITGIQYGERPDIFGWMQPA